MHPDFKDLLSEFIDQKVEFLLVGAHALAAHGHVRATKDIDLWVRPDSANARRVFAALARFGAPLAGVDVTDFETPGVVFQIGVEPVRIDILTTVDGLDFEEAWSGRLTIQLEELSVPLISKSDLIRNKKASGRLQDLADVEKLEEQ
ncbi:MAG: DUF6036 family nucleotidyltransferase [Myxococcota bacterium]